jgi:hypothetical protein
MHAPQLERQQQRGVGRHRVAHEIADTISFITANLEAQAEQVRLIESDADASSSNVRDGVDELRKLRSGPSTLRNFGVALALGLTAALLFLHWFTP